MRFFLASLLSLATSLTHRSFRSATAMAVYDRSILPSRPVPWVSQSRKSKPEDASTSSGAPKVLDAARLIGLKRVGAVAIAPNGKQAVVHVSEYDFDAKKSIQQLWSADLELASTPTHISIHTCLSLAPDSPPKMGQLAPESRARVST